MTDKEFKLGGVRLLPGSNSGKYPHCHSIYIEQAGVLIDPASDRKRLKQLRDDNKVNQIWLTHWHEDHIAHLDLFDGLPLLMSPIDAPPLADMETFMDWYGMDSPQYRETWAQIMLSQFHFKPRRPSGSLEGGQVIQLGELTVEVISAPGHTPGSLCFYFREPEILFMADYDLTWFGPWYGDCESSISKTISTVRKLREIPAQTWLTCHETGVFREQPGRLWDDFLAVIQTREDKLLDYLAQPRTNDEIVEAWIIYGKPREPKDFFYFAEGAMIKKHIEDLSERGLIYVDGERWRTKK